MVINFFGRRGSGKTTAIRGQLQDCRAPVIIIDILGNYADLENCYHTHDLGDLIHALKQNHSRQNEFMFFCLKSHSPTLAANYLSAVIWELNGGTLVLDEVDSIQVKEGSCFDKYIRYGRNHHGDLITGCRRPAELDKNITAAGNKFYCFNTHEPRDIEYFQNALFGERATMLLNLPPYHGLFLDYDSHIWGEFHIDINGNIFHLSENHLD